MKSHQELLNRIAVWHQSQEHGTIKSAILALPVSERSDELLSLLTRAMFNEDEFTAALEVLDSLTQRCSDEPWYCLRRALTLWQMNREDEALPWFRKAQSLGLQEIDELPGTFFPKLVSKWVERAETWAPRRIEMKNFVAQRRSARHKEAQVASFAAVDLAGLWDDSEYSLNKYIGATPSAEEFESIESELGYRLPEAYKALMLLHNGGILARNSYPNPLCRDWTTAAFSVESIYGVDRSKPYSLCGSRGSKFWTEQWRYLEIGIAIADTISAGHQMIFLDYSDCGADGEPCVVSVDQESNYEISYVADNFAQLIRGLAVADDEELDDD